jgi:hypothetical protein
MVSPRVYDGRRKLVTHAASGRRLRQRHCLHAQERLKIRLIPQHFGECAFSFLTGQEQVAMPELTPADAPVDKREEPRHGRSAYPAYKRDCLNHGTASHS